MDEFNHVWSVARCFSWGLKEAEARRLWELARGRTVVEVGCFRGCSACVLASIGPVACIDPFWPNGRYSGNGYRSDILVTEWGRFRATDILGEFLKNTAPRRDRITLLTLPDAQVWPVWRSPVELLFLDHDHSRETVAASLIGWRPHLEDEAIVALHDYGNPDWPGVKAAVDASELIVEDVVGTLAVGRFS